MRSRHVIALFAVLLLPAYTYALDVGFEAFIGADGSDNINSDNKGAELDGSEATFSFSVFGAHDTRRVQGAFEGEFITDRQFDDEDTDTDLNTVTRFFGAANVLLTQRALSWYVGDAIGTVLEEGRLQSIDNQGVQRNVFVTGPELKFDIDRVRSFNTRFLYVIQSDDSDEDLATLYNFNSRFETKLAAGHRWGFSLSDIYSDNPDEQFGTDLNRLSAALFWGRQRNLVDMVFRLGATQYDAEGDAVTGLLASFDFTRSLTARSSVAFSIGHDLVDENLNSIETISSVGTTTDEDLDGVSQNTTVDFTYKITTGDNSVTAGIGALDSEFKRTTSVTGFNSTNVNTDDKHQYYAKLSLARAMNIKWYMALGVSYIQEEFVNRTGETNSLVVDASANYRLSRSWNFVAGLIHGQEDGLEFDTAGLNSTVVPFDRVENRIRLGLQWKPPTKVSNATTFKLKSLLN